MMPILLRAADIIAGGPEIGDIHGARIVLVRALRQALREAGVEPSLAAIRGLRTRVEPHLKGHTREALAAALRAAAR